MKNQTSQPPQEWSRWSNRILIVSLIGIVYLTLFPFRFDFAIRHPLRTSPFLLGAPVKHEVHFDFVLNVLLFVPFGFGLAAQMRKRGASQARALILAFAAGAIASYVVEFLQFYIPTRNSGWGDIAPNTLGSVAGFILFDRCGEMLLKPASGWEERVEAWLSLRRTCVFLLVYVGFFFTISILLQRETRLSNWDTTVPMFIGSDGTARHAWKGQIAKVQIWNRALSDESARKLTAGEDAPDSETGVLASYEFTGAPPYGDRTKSLPALTWISSSQPPHDLRGLDLDGSSWLSSIVPVRDLTQELKRTNQFSVRAVCAPVDVADFDQRIVSISRASGFANLTLRRDGPNLSVWVRNPLAVYRTDVAWYVREIYVRDIFVAGQVRDILVSYDGSDVSLYVDGKKEPRVFYLSPGAALARRFVRFRTSDWDGYVVTYDALIFIPAGFLLGVIARKEPSQKLTGLFLLLVGLLLPSVLYEVILVWVSGRAVSSWQVSLCLFLTLLGAWLINADRSDGILFHVL
jgi:glycopeptide antibiotics resistance protein